MIARADDPKSVALRRALATWLYEQKVSELVANVDEEKWLLAEKAGLAITEHAARTERVQSARISLISAFLKRHSDHSVKEALATYGVAPAFDFDALAEATWPAVKTVATSPVATAYVSNIVAEFIASESRAPSSSS